MEKLNLFARSLLSKLRASDLFMRAWHTFYQGFSVVFLAGLLNVAHAFGKTGLAGAKSAVLALALASVMAGISALKTQFWPVLKTKLLG